MPKEELGYIELEWTCRNCNTRNKGADKVCRNCGSPMAEDQEFELPAQQEISAPPQAKEEEAGPDIHCPYCGARNVATAARCVRCGGELVEGKKREQSKVLGAFRAEKAPDIICPYCQTPNPATALQCSKCGGSLAKPKPEPAPKAETKGFRFTPLMLGIVAIVVLLCGALAFALFRTSDVTATVQDVSWTRTIAIQALQPVKKEGWRNEVPNEARLGSCEKKLRRVQEQEAPGAKKVCGTPYVVDQGTGKGKVMQDCKYEIYEDWCQYEVNDWVKVREEKASRHDLQPVWPAVSLGVKEREQKDGRKEEYAVVFDRDGKRYTYSPPASEFAKFQVGSVWKLKVNRLGGVTSVSPAR